MNYHVERTTLCRRVSVTGKKPCRRILGPGIPARAIMVLTVCLLLFPAPVLFGSGGRETSRAPAAQRLTIGILPDVDSIPIILAAERGYFTAPGGLSTDTPVEIRIEIFTSPVNRDTALQTGYIDGAISDILAAGFAKNGGFDVVMTSMTNGSYKLLGAPGKNIARIEDLGGKKIAISRNTIIEYTLDRMLAEREMSGGDGGEAAKTWAARQSVEKVAIPQIPVRLEMLREGKIDGAVLPEPLATAAAVFGAELIDSSDRLGINPGILLFIRRAVDEKEEALRVFYRGYNRGVEEIMTRPREEWIGTVMARGGFPEAVRNEMVLPEYHPARMPDEKEFLEVMSWLTERSLIERAFRYDELSDSRFVEQGEMGETAF